MPHFRELRPSSIDGIKRLADRLQAEHPLQRAAALDEAARLAGFQNFAHARRAIEASERQRSEVRARRRAFTERARSEWAAAVSAVLGPERPLSTQWTSLYDIISVLQPFMGEARNHGHFPGGGGHDFVSVRPAAERGCLEFQVTPKMFYLGKPRRLVIEHFEQDVAQTFLMLEFDELAPTGVYDREDDELEGIEHRWQRGSEELVDLGRANYVEREIWDRGFVQDEDDELPDTARLVHRLHRGKVMIVCKGSIWNSTSRTYDGIHDRVPITEIRAGLERIIRTRAA